MTDSGDDATGEELGEGGDLHGAERGVARAGGQDADAHDDAFGRREDGGRLGDTAAEAEVLDDPQLVEAEGVGASGELEHLGGREVAGEHDADAAGGWSRHASDPVRATAQRRSLASSTKRR